MIFSSRGIQLFVLSVIIVLGLVGSSSAEPCGIELQKRSPVTIDGSNSSGEWAQGGEITSMEGCLDQVHVIESGQPYPITVYSRRYDQGGTEYLGFLFEVPDATTEYTNNPSQSTQEQIYLYFDPDRSEGSMLSTGTAGGDGTDYRLKLQHQWTSQSTGGLQSTLEWGTPTSSATCQPNEFQSVNPPSTAKASVAQRSPGPGYIAEIRIPVSAIGSPGSDIGIAFAVVDDQGTHSVSSAVTDKYAASFPASLPSSNADNPANSCPEEYHKPENYGVGLWTSTAGDVTISRQPVFWDSQDIRALQCGEMSTYTYYPDAPCELTLEATIHNSRGVDLDRHVLYVWADHGANPSNWQVVDLQETTVPASGDVTNTSEIWTQVPFGLAHHPCVRAYILPDNLNQGGWNENMVRNVSSNADLSNMMAAYDLNTANWAQKNISASSTARECPTDGCRVEGGAPPMGVRLDGGGSGTVPILWGWLFILFLASVWMILHFLPRRFARLALSLVVLLTVAVACQAVEEVDDGPDEMQSPPVLMSPSEFERFHPDHAIVQMQVFGYMPLEKPQPESANFYDVLGGVIRLLPSQQVVEQGEGGLPIALQVSNTEEEPRRLLLKVKSVLPPKLQEENLQLTFEQEHEEVILEPGDTRTLHGQLQLHSVENE